MTSNPPPPKAGQAQTHTPTPWKLYIPADEDSYYAPGIVPDADRTGDIAVYSVDAEDNSGIQGKTREEARANAAFIVTACNAHSSLLASHEQAKAREDALIVELQDARIELAALKLCDIPALKASHERLKQALEGAETTLRRCTAYAPNDEKVELIMTTVRKVVAALSTAHSVNNGQ